MKKNYILLLIILITFVSFGQTHDFDSQGILTSSLSSGGNSLQFEVDSNVAPLIFELTGTESYISFKMKDLGINPYSRMEISNEHDFTFNFSSANEIMRFHSTDSSVSIGTSEKANGYKLSIGGKIMTEGIRVQSVANWPDFVFSSNYSLSSLEDLEKYINKNGHLPNIPSAKVVKKEGISLEEMDSKLLQKIEELTLYVIDINKENQKLKNEIKLLKIKNNLK